MTIPRFSFADETLTGEVSGALTADAAGAVPIYDIRGSISHADVASCTGAVRAGRVARAWAYRHAHERAVASRDGTFEVKGPVDAKSISDATRFVGGFNLKDARIPADDVWPETHSIDARVEWNGSRVRASVEEGNARAHSSSKRLKRSGTLRARVRRGSRVARMASWSRRSRGCAITPNLQQHAPHLQELVAKGDALFDFDVSVAGCCFCQAASGAIP